MDAEVRVSSLLPNISSAHAIIRSIFSQFLNHSKEHPWSWEEFPALELFSLPFSKHHMYTIACFSSNENDSCDSSEIAASRVRSDACFIFTRNPNTSLLDLMDASHDQALSWSRVLL